MSEEEARKLVDKINSSISADYLAQLVRIGDDPGFYYYVIVKKVD